MNITQCLHTAIIVSDLEKADHFYGHILGLPKVERQLKFAGIWYQVANYQIHLMVHPKAQGSLYNAEKWGRNPHLAFSVINLEDAIARLKQYDCPIQMSHSGRTALFTQDPDGNIIEISQA
jgi:glyoxylase I family protein